jgi:hypothetical protein
MDAGSILDQWSCITPPHLQPHDSQTKVFVPLTQRLKVMKFFQLQSVGKKIPLNWVDKIWPWWHNESYASSEKSIRRPSVLWVRLCWVVNKFLYWLPESIIGRSIFLILEVKKTVIPWRLQKCSSSVTPSNQISYFLPCSSSMRKRKCVDMRWSI